MSDGQILDLRKAIVARLRENLPGVDVQEHPRAELSTKDIDRCLREHDRALALRVSFAGVKGDAAISSYDTDTPEAWCIYLIARDVADGKRTIPRDVTILRVLPTVLRTVCTDGWDVGDDVNMRKPEQVRGEQLYAGEEEAAARSAMIWAVSWLQTACIPPEPVDDLRPFLTLITKYDLEPADGGFEATDTIALEQD